MISLIIDVIDWFFDIIPLILLFIFFGVVGSIAWYFLSRFLDL